jgi:hypothetical protein
VRPLRHSILVVLTTMTIIFVMSSGCIELGASDLNDVGRVNNLHLEETTVYLGLVWEVVEGADYYRIYRDGGLLLETEDPFYNDSNVGWGEEHSYQVRAAKSLSPSGARLGELSEPVSGTLSAITYDDEGFREFAMDVAELIRGICYDLQRAGIELDIAETEGLSEELRERSSHFLQMSYDFNISMELQQAMEEFRLAMDDFILAGQFISEGIGSLDQDRIEEGAMLIGSGADHLVSMSEAL